MPDPYQYVKLPDGSYGKFAADAGDDVIKAAIAKDFPSAFQQTMKDKIMALSAATKTHAGGAPGYQMPAAQTPWSDTGILAGARRGASAIGGAPYDIGQAVATPPTNPQEANGYSPTAEGQVALAAKRLVGAPMDEQAAKSRAAFAGGHPVYGTLHAIASGVPVLGPLVGNLAERGAKGDISGALTEGGMYAIAGKAGGEVAPEVADIAGRMKIPSKAGAAQNFQQVMKAIGDKPVDVSGAGQVALETADIAKRGGRLPKVIADFMRRVTDPQQGPLTYAEARDFYSNASALTPEEMTTLKPRIRAQVAKFTKELGSSIQNTADQGGVGEQYSGAMKEFRRASQLGDSLDVAKGTLKNLLVKGVPYAGGAYSLSKIINGGR